MYAVLSYYCMQVKARVVNVDGHSVLAETIEFATKVLSLLVQQHTQQYKY